MFTSANPAGTTSQTKYPARALVRTLLQVVIALAVGLPFLVDAAGLSEAIPGVSVALAVAAAITRVMALPWTEDFLERFIPWLAAEPTSARMSANGMGGDALSAE